MHEKTGGHLYHRIAAKFGRMRDREHFAKNHVSERFKSYSYELVCEGFHSVILLHKVLHSWHRLCETLTSFNTETCKNACTTPLPFSEQVLRRTWPSLSSRLDPSEYLSMTIPAELRERRQPTFTLTRPFRATSPGGRGGDDTLGHHRPLGRCAPLPSPTGAPPAASATASATSARIVSRPP